MTMQAPRGEVLVYEAPEGGVRVEVTLDRETVWLTQRQMAELFETTPENVLMHLKNIYADAELEELATAKEFLAVRVEGERRVRRRVKHYNLDAIISVGYRVNSRARRAFPRYCGVRARLGRPRLSSRSATRCTALLLSAAPPAFPLSGLKRAARSPLADSPRSRPSLGGAL